MVGINPKWLDRLDEKKRKFCLTAAGFKFLFKFLWAYGQHLLVLGTTGAGKTQRFYWLVSWMVHTKETIIWLDSCKNREITPLLKMGMPVRVIVPKGCGVQFTEWSEVEHKYVPMVDHPEIVTVPDAGSAWWAAKKGHINIFSFRNCFATDDARLYWMADLFTTLAVWLRKSTFPKITPFCIYGDEFQWVNAGESVSSDQARNKVSEGISENAFEIRGYGGRIVVGTQLYKNIPPATRKNLPSVLLLRDALVDAGENPALGRFNAFVPYYKPNEGLFVYPDKKPVPATSPWLFPYFEKPKIRVAYLGEYDRPTAEAKAEDEVVQECIPDLSKYSALCQDLQGYEVPATISRYEAIPDDST